MKSNTLKNFLITATSVALICIAIAKPSLSNRKTAVKNIDICSVKNAAEIVLDNSLISSVKKVSTLDTKVGISTDLMKNNFIKALKGKSIKSVSDAVSSPFFEDLIFLFIYENQNEKEITEAFSKGISGSYLGFDASGITYSINGDIISVVGRFRPASLFLFSGKVAASKFKDPIVLKNEVKGVKLKFNLANSPFHISDITLKTLGSVKKTNSSNSKGSVPVNLDLNLNCNLKASTTQRQTSAQDAGGQNNLGNLDGINETQGADGQIPLSPDIPICIDSAVKKYPKAPSACPTGAALTQACFDASKKIEELENELKNLDAAIETLTTTVSELETRIASLQVGLDALKKSKQDLEDSISGLSGSLLSAEEKNEIKAKINRITLSINTIENLIKDLQAELDCAKSALEADQESAQNAQEAIDSWNEFIERCCRGVPVELSPVPQTTIPPSPTPTYTPPPTATNTPKVVPTSPTPVPSTTASPKPTVPPSVAPSSPPTSNPSSTPTKVPTANPSGSATPRPSTSPSAPPTTSPSTAPTSSTTPARSPTTNPTFVPK